jgi:hypothetical protein
MGIDGALPEQPPADPEAWTDDQWLAWLTATDEAIDAGTPPASRGTKITHSAAGHALGQAMLGLAHAIYGRQDNEVVVVVEGEGEPGGDQPFTVHLDPDHPERTYVTLHRAPRPPD